MSAGGTHLQGKIRRTKYVYLGREMTKQRGGSDKCLQIFEGRTH